MSHGDGRFDRKDHLIDSSKSLRYSFNADEKAFDMITHGNELINKKFNRTVLTNNADHLTTSISYYSDNVVEVSDINPVPDVGGNLASKYFVFYVGLDRVKYYVWYKVSGVGTDPAIADATGIEVSILNNDLIAVISLATKNAIDIVADFYVKTKVVGEKLTITNRQGGVTSNTADGDTGFTFSTDTSGSSELVGIIDIVYNGCDIVSKTGY